MPANHPLRLAALALGAIALLAVLLLALFDWSTALILLAALVVGWLLVIATAVGATVYRRHTRIALGVLAVVALVLLVVLRPDGSGPDEAAEPMAVSSYTAEIWPNRMAAGAAFILRERADIGREAGEDPVDGRGTVIPVTTGPLMRELRFATGAGTGLGTIRLREGAAGMIIVNPIDGAEVHHARGGDVARVQLPIGPVVQVELEQLPSEARVAYLVGAGRTLAPLASIVTPLRRWPIVLVVTLFALIGALAARALSDRLVRPVHKRLTEKPPPPAKPGSGQPGAPIERAPLVPRRK